MCKTVQCIYPSLLKNHKYATKFSHWKCHSTVQMKSFVYHSIPQLLGQIYIYICQIHCHVLVLALSQPPGKLNQVQLTYLTPGSTQYSLSKDCKRKCNCHLFYAFHSIWDKIFKGCLLLLSVAECTMSVNLQGQCTLGGFSLECCTSIVLGLWAKGKTLKLQQCYSWQSDISNEDMTSILMHLLINHTVSDRKRRSERFYSAQYLSAKISPQSEEFLYGGQ